MSKPIKHYTAARMSDQSAGSSKKAKLIPFLWLFLLVGMMNACTGVSQQGQPAPSSNDRLPTFVALTLEAAGKIQTPGAANPQPTNETLTVGTASPMTGDTASPVMSPRPSTATRTPASPTETAAVEPLSAIPTDTPFPEIPDAEVKINRLGDLSRVTSPFLVNAYLSSKVGKRVLVELYGEDGRLLAQEEQIYHDLPWSFANLSVYLEYEIAVPAEVGHLVVSVEDVFGRVIAVNSVDLILLSIGQADLNPPTALLEAISIQEPHESSLVQGGNLVVSGLSRPSSQRLLHVELVAEDGSNLGKTLVGVDQPPGGGYAPFLAEIPYSVKELTPVRLIVYEEGETIPIPSHLSSIEIVLSP